MKIVGADCKSGNVINLIDDVQSQLNEIGFSWKLEATSANCVTLPCYLYSDRQDLLFNMDFAPNVDKALLYERGVAVVCSDM